MDWESRYVDGFTPWNLKGAHPLLAELLQLGQGLTTLSEGDLGVVPGAGHAHDAAALSQAGFRVLAIDVAPSAVEEAKAAYGSTEGMKIALGDALECADSDRSSCDFIFDRAMACALPEPLRKEYFDACLSRLKSGGLFLSIPFVQVAVEQGPPFAVDEKSFRTQLLGSGFVDVQWAARVDGALDEIILSEALCVAKKP